MIPFQQKWIKTMVKAVLPHVAQRWSQNQQRWTRDQDLFQRYLRPTDVFLVGHPKSGNTLLAYMLAITMNKNFDGKQVTLANIREFIPTIHAKDGDIKAYAQFPTPRIFRNEGPRYPDSYPRTVYILRDPRSVLMSYYHHCIHDTDNYEWKFDTFLDEMLAYGCIKRLEPYILRWDKQVLQWVERSKVQPVKIVKYEDMIRDRRQVLSEVIDFVGISCEEADIALAVERSSFENMRKEEETYGAEPYSGDKGERGYFVRRGKVDGWKEEMTEDLAKRIETEFADAMQTVGYLQHKA